MIRAQEERRGKERKGESLVGNEINRIGSE